MNKYHLVRSWVIEDSRYSASNEQDLSEVIDNVEGSGEYYTIQILSKKSIANARFPCGRPS